MKLHCRLRELRGSRSLRAVAEEAGVSRGQLSEIERGYRLPPDAWLERLERAYGASPEEWYGAADAARARHESDRTPRD